MSVVDFSVWLIFLWFVAYVSSVSHMVFEALARMMYVILGLVFTVTALGLLQQPAKMNFVFSGHRLCP